MNDTTIPFQLENRRSWEYSLCIWNPFKKLAYFDTAGRSVKMSRRALERPPAGVNMEVGISWGLSGKSGTSSEEK